MESARYILESMGQKSLSDIAREKAMASSGHMMGQQGNLTGGKMIESTGEIIANMQIGKYGLMEQAMAEPITSVFPKSYASLRAININEHVEKKNNLSYLSWAWAVDQLLMLDDNASWSYGEPKDWNGTYMVFCTVSAFGRHRTAQLPVMDYKNKAITNPDSFSVNTAMQRCLAKAIALHGIGLYIYAGEDLPEEPKNTIGDGLSDVDASVEERIAAEFQEREERVVQITKEIEAEFLAKGVAAAYANYLRLTLALRDKDKTAIRHALAETTRVELKKHADSMKGKP